jgi:LmbE family N-acetylglucosaminyl deacetylase
VSPHTGHGPFLGRTLTRQLAEVIRRRQPTLVVYPDPRDTHADHAAAGQFTAAALATAGSMATALTYFVHDAEWPPPLDPSRPMPVPPDVALRETRWVSLSLSATELEAKRRALDAHRSQWPVLGGLLERFLRPNEIFATGPPPG